MKKSLENILKERLIDINEDIGFLEYLSNKSDVYCPLINNHISINSQGNYQLCCFSEQYDKKLNIKDVDFNNYLKSDLLNDIKCDSKNNIKNKYCINCYKNEINNIPSKRIFEIFLEYKTKNREMSFDFNFGSLCNLKCVMCSEENSIQLYSERLKDDNEFTVQKIKDRYDDIKNINRKILENFIQLNKISFWKSTGGEPLLIPEFKQMISHCVENEKSKYIDLRFNTNLSIIDYDIFDMIKQFKKHIIYVSMDGIDETFEYIRYPLEFEKFKNNLKILRDNDINFIIDFSFQTLNMNNIRDTLIFLNDNNYQINLNFVYSDIMFNASFTTYESKNECIDSISNLNLPNLKSTLFTDSLKDINIKIKNFLYSNNYDKVIHNKLLKFISNNNKRRGLDYEFDL